MSEGNIAYTYLLSLQRAGQVVNLCAAHFLSANSYECVYHCCTTGPAFIAESRHRASQVTPSVSTASSRIPLLHTLLSVVVLFLNTNIGHPQGRHAKAPTHGECHLRSVSPNRIPVTMCNAPIQTLELVVNIGG